MNTIYTYFEYIDCFHSGEPLAFNSFDNAMDYALKRYNEEKAKEPDVKSEFKILNEKSNEPRIQASVETFKGWWCEVWKCNLKDNV